MSSYLSKSKKDFKPKIAPRRAVAAVTSTPSQVRGSVERQSTQLRSTPAFEFHQASPQPGTSIHPREGHLHVDATPGERDVPRVREISVDRQGRATPHQDEEVLHVERWHLGQPAEPGLRASPNNSSKYQNLPHLLTPAPSQREAETGEPQQRDSLPLPNQKSSLKRRRDDAPTTSSGDLHQYRGERRRTPDEVSAQGRRSPQPTKRSRMDDVASEIISEALADRNATEPLDESQRKPRRKRETTPDGADKALISPTLITMSELTKDLRLGKKSKREQRLQEKDKVAAAKRKIVAQAKARDQAQELMAGPTASGMANGVHSPAQGSVAESASTNQPPKSVAPPARVAPRTRVVNGQIVQDEESRIVNRNQAAAAAAGFITSIPADAIEEDELTRQVNSGNFMKRERHTKWNSEETERFYTGLRWFGTDFQTIAFMFPGRTRRQIKLKFNKEERDPVKADDVLRALHDERCPADLVKFEEYSRMALRDPEVLEKELAEDRRLLEQAQEKETEAVQKAAREREEQAEREAEAARQKEAAASPSTKKAANDKASKHPVVPLAGGTGTAAESSMAKSENKGRGRAGNARAKGKETVVAATTDNAGAESKRKAKGKEKATNASSKEAPSRAARPSDTVTIEHTQPASSSPKRRGRARQKKATSNRPNAEGNQTSVSAQGVHTTAKHKATGKKKGTAAVHSADEIRPEPGNEVDTNMEAQSTNSLEKGHGRGRGKRQQKESSRLSNEEPRMASQIMGSDDKTAPEPTVPLLKGRGRGNSKQKASATASNLSVSRETVASSIPHVVDAAAIEENIPGKSNNSGRRTRAPRNSQAILETASNIERARSLSPIEDSIIVVTPNNATTAAPSKRTCSGNSAASKTQGPARPRGRPRKYPLVNGKLVGNPETSGKGTIARPNAKGTGRTKGQPKTSTSKVTKQRVARQNDEKPQGRKVELQFKGTRAETQAAAETLLRAAG